MDKIYKIITTEKGKTWDRLELRSSDYAECISCKKASLKEMFDFYIKQSFIEGKSYLPGLYLKNNKSDNFGFYVKRYDRIYDRYLSENLKIKEALADDIKKRYDEGEGNEFNTGKYYSVASSSRFATACFSKKSEDKPVSLLEEIEIGGTQKKCKIELEKGLEVLSKNGDVISKPQMDVVIDTGDDIYFIEAKCHEIFDNHKSIKMKWKYMESEMMKSFLGDCSNISELLIKENKKQVSYIGINNEFLSPQDFGCNLKTNHFDFKQFLCHLMGIMSYQKSKGKQIHFYYLFYKNEEYLKNVESKLYEELDDEMNLVIEHFGKLYPAIMFGYFYHNRYDTLNAIKLER